MRIYINEENTEYNILRNNRFKEGIKAKIIQYNDTMLEQEMYLEIIEYDTVNNVIVVKQVEEKKTDNIHINRTLQYLYLATRFFNTKYSIKAVYSFLTDERVKELNLYDEIKMNSQRIKEDLSQISSSVIKNLENTY